MWSIGFVLRGFQFTAFMELAAAAALTTGAIGVGNLKDPVMLSNDVCDDYDAAFAYVANEETDDDDCDAYEAAFAYVANKSDVDCCDDQQTQTQRILLAK